MATMSIIEFKVNGTTSTRLNVKGEIALSSLTREVQKWFDGHTTNHFGTTEAVLQDCLIEIAEDVTCEISIEEYDDDNDIIFFSNIKDFDDKVIDYEVLALVDNIFA